MQDLRDGSPEAVIAKCDVELERLFETIPPRYRGVLFEKVLERTGKLELAFAEELAEKHRHQDFLCLLFHPRMDMEYDERTPKTEREWQVAQYAIASFNQWLGTPVGAGHMKNSYRRAGGKLTEEIPEI